ncbi:hypothetical protein [Streptomyces violaceusniger]|uniref:hypothetical protein n=1 Tax=Streptomyces violaceusniger TaxID=68280 RepID=UPI0001E4D90E|nr:hypothetical protein [Streptomyces violaceusniger]
MPDAPTTTGSPDSSTGSPESSTGSPDSGLGDNRIRALDAHWRAANYLAAGQIYLLANPLLWTASGW